MIVYYKLYVLLNKRGMRLTDLLEIMSSPTLAKLSKGESITTGIICRICEFMDCQPGDIMEYIPLSEEEKEQRRQRKQKKAKG